MLGVIVGFRRSPRSANVVCLSVCLSDRLTMRSRVYIGHSLASVRWSAWGYNLINLEDPALTDFINRIPSISTSHLHIATATLSLSDQSNLAQTITGNHWHYFVSPQLHNNDWDWETWGGILYSWLDTDWILICEMRSSSSSSSHQPSPYKARPMLSCQGLAAKPAHFLNQKVGAGRLMKKKTIESN